ncbi:MAG: hypothetical protein LBG43_11775 [Treponema sp.]|jgi:hypothetical protein|nr:hypothetical protein [Treponema sp.]
MNALDAELKAYVNEYGRDNFTEKFEKTIFSNKLSRDMDNSEIGVTANAVMEKFKSIPLASDPKPESVFAGYVCQNIIYRWNVIRH